MLAAVLFSPFVSYCFMEEVLRGALARFCIRLSVPHEKKLAPRSLEGGCCAPVRTRLSLAGIANFAQKALRSILLRSIENTMNILNKMAVM